MNKQKGFVETVVAVIATIVIAGISATVAVYDHEQREHATEHAAQAVSAPATTATAADKS